MSDYSYQEIGGFLEIPVYTVKMRLYHARQQLKERLITMIEDNLEEQRPSKNSAFVEGVLNLSDRVAELDQALQQLVGAAIDLKTVLAPDLWPVKADPAQADQVVTNLAV